MNKGELSGLRIRKSRTWPWLCVTLGKSPHLAGPRFPHMHYESFGLNDPKENYAAGIRYRVSGRKYGGASPMNLGKHVCRLADSWGQCLSPLPVPSARTCPAAT